MNQNDIDPEKYFLTIFLFLVQKLLAPVKLHNVRPFTQRLLQKYRKGSESTSQSNLLPPFSLSSPSCFCQSTNRPTSRAAAFVSPSAARRCPHMKPIVLGWLNGRTPLAAGHCFCFTLFTLIKNCHSVPRCSAAVCTSFTGGAVQWGSSLLIRQLHRTHPRNYTSTHTHPRTHTYTHTGRATALSLVRQTKSQTNKTLQDSHFRYFTLKSSQASHFHLCSSDCGHASAAARSQSPVIRWWRRIKK